MPDDFDEADDDVSRRRIIESIQRKLDTLYWWASSMTAAFGWIVARLNVDDRFNEVSMRMKDLERMFGGRRPKS